MDMNAGFGGFAAAMAKYQVWVMNVVPYDAKNNSLGIIYERGLIGAYTNWYLQFIISFLFIFLLFGKKIC